MSDRVCVRGCKQKGVHYATCGWSGVQEGVVPFMAFCSPGAPERCTGCAEREARDGALICSSCYGRARWLLRDFDDMMGRLDSLADPMKATPTDKTPGGSRSSEPIAPTDADLLDAIRDVSRTAIAWAEFTGHRTIDEAFDDIANDREDVLRFAEGWMDRTPVVDGIRDFWTVADAMAKWGPERRTKGEPEWVEDATSEEVLAIPEWGDQLLNRAEADREAGSASTLRRWLQHDLITAVGTIYVAGRRTTLFRRSDLLRVKAAQAEKQRTGRPPASDVD